MADGGVTRETLTAPNFSSNRTATPPPSRSRRRWSSDGIPSTSFAVDDVAAGVRATRALGVRFTQQPAEMGPVTTAVFDDTCGNLIQIQQRK